MNSSARRNAAALPFLGDAPCSDCVCVQNSRQPSAVGRALRGRIHDPSTCSRDVHCARHDRRPAARQRADGWWRSRDELLSLTLSGPVSSPGTLPVASVPIRASDLPTGPWREAAAAASGERLLLAHATVVATRTCRVAAQPVGRPSSTGHLRRQAASLRASKGVCLNGDHCTAWQGKGKVRRRVERHCADAGLTAGGDALADVLDQAGVDLTGVSRPPAKLNDATPALDGFRSVLFDLFVAVEGHWRGALESR